MNPDAEVLRRLVAQLRSASAAYRRAGADGPGLSDVFGGAADAHDRAAEALVAMVRALGVEPDDAAGAEAADGPWTVLPRAVAQSGRVVAQAVQATEDELLRVSHAAAGDPELSGPVHDEILRVAEGLKSVRNRTLQRLDALQG